jgi:hypothetical protein
MKKNYCFLYRFKRLVIYNFWHYLSAILQFLVGLIDDVSFLALLLLKIDFTLSLFWGRTEIRCVITKSTVKRLYRYHFKRNVKYWISLSYNLNRKKNLLETTA